MRPWIPLVLAVALLAVPGAAAQSPEGGLDTSTTLSTEAGLVLAPGEAGVVETEVVYRHRPVPSTSTTPTHLGVKEAPSSLKLAFSPSTVHHETHAPQDADTTQVSVRTSKLTVLAAEDAAPGAYTLTLEGLSEANGPHDASKGETDLIVKIDDDASTSTQAAAAAPAAGPSLGAIVGLVAVAGLASAAVAFRRRG